MSYVNLYEAAAGLGVTQVHKSVLEYYRGNKPPPVPACLKPEDIVYVQKCMQDGMAGKEPAKDTVCWHLMNNEAFAAAGEKLQPCPTAQPPLQIKATPQPVTAAPAAKLSTGMWAFYIVGAACLAAVVYKATR